MEEREIKESIERAMEHRHDMDDAAEADALVDSLMNSSAC